MKNYPNRYRCFPTRPESENGSVYFLLSDHVRLLLATTIRGSISLLGPPGTSLNNAQPEGDDPLSLSKVARAPSPLAAK